MIKYHINTMCFVPCFTWRVVCVNIPVEIRNVHTLHYLHNWYLFILRRMVGWTLLQLSEIIFPAGGHHGPLSFSFITAAVGHFGWGGGDCEEKSLEQSFLRRTGWVSESTLKASNFLTGVSFQENGPGTATFMEDSARDGGTVILAEVIWLRLMI